VQPFSQAYFRETSSITSRDAGTYSSRSLISSPIKFISSLQCGHCRSLPAKSNTIRRRSSDFGSRCRPWPSPLGFVDRAFLTGEAALSALTISAANKNNWFSFTRSRLGP
jgi:hypothetical protein